MESRSGIGQYVIPLMRGMEVDPTIALRGWTGAAWLRVTRAASTRGTYAYLGMLGVPLGVVAAVLSGLWWVVVPLAVLAWWWAPDSWGWEWLSAIGRGVLGVEWAFAGSGALAAFPSHLWLTGALWTAFPTAVVAFRLLYRRQRIQV
jgi:hypothetical protein